MVQPNHQLQLHHRLVKIRDQQQILIDMAARAAGQFIEYDNLTWLFNLKLELYSIEKLSVVRVFDLLNEF